MSLKIVIENAVLRGLQGDGVLQRVATVYPIGENEYLVYAPGKATGNSLEWLEHCVVHQVSESGLGENYVTDGRKGVILGRVKEKLQALELDADIWRDVNSQGRYCAAQICL